MDDEIADALRRRGIQPSAQRVAIAGFILATDRHPSADQVWGEVKQRLPVLSRATVYNTLNLFVAKGLVRQLVLAEGNVVFDPKVEPHHHFVDEASGAIHDIPWDELEIRGIDGLADVDVHEYQVVLRGRRRADDRKS